ncbi:MAG: hypothetical protein IJO32_07035 [Bacilli bacterium]|nr:hypothetical protein [Bacilli bacterium]
MNKIEITKKGKITLIIIGTVLVILGIVLFFVMKTPKAVEPNFLNLNVTPISVDSKWDEEKLSLILHVNSQAQLAYNVYPENARVEEITFNNFDRDIIKIDSLGVITGKKTGITELQIRSGNAKSFRIKVYVY